MSTTLLQPTFNRISRNNSHGFQVAEMSALLNLQQCWSHTEELWRRLFNELLCGILLAPSISSRPIKFSQPSAEWATFCLQPYPKQGVLMCSNTYDCQSNYREKPFNGTVKQKRRNRKEQRLKKSLSVLASYQQAFPIPSNRGRKRIKRRRKWGAQARP